MAAGIPSKLFPIAGALVLTFGLLVTTLIAVRSAGYINADDWKSFVETHCTNLRFWSSFITSAPNVMPSRWTWRWSAGFYVLFHILTSSHLFFVSRRGPSQAQRTLAPLHAALELVRMLSVVGWSVVFEKEAPYWFASCFVTYLLSSLCVFGLMVVDIRCTSPELAQKCKRLRLILLTGIAVLGIAYSALLVPKTYESCVAEDGMPGVWVACIFVLLFGAFEATAYYELEGRGNWTLDFEHMLGSSRSGEGSSTAPNTTNSSLLLWMADIYFSYLQWGSIAQLYQVVYYGPMVAMSFTIEAVFLLLPNAACIALGNRRVWSLLAPRRVGGSDGYGFLYLVSVVGLFSYDCISDAGQRTIGVAFLCATLSTAQRVRFLALTVPDQDEYDQTTEDQSRLVYSVPLGLVLSMIARLSWVSLDPIHTSPLVSGLAIPLTTFFGWIMLRQALYGSNHLHSQLPSSPHSSRVASVPKVQLPQVTSRTALLTGFALGAWKEIALQFLINSGILSRFIGGIQPFPSGILVIFAFTLGVWQDSVREGNSPLAPQQLAAGLLATASVLYYGSSGSDRMFQKSSTKPVWYDTPLKGLSIDDWYTENQWGSPAVAFMGGIGMIYLLGLMIPSLLVRGFPNPKDSPALVSAGRIEVFSTLSEWIVLFTGLCVTSYPFIPGGFFFRDHYQYYLLGGLVILCVCYIRLSTQLPGVATRSEPRRSILTPGILVFLLSATLFLSGWREFLATPDNNAAPSGILSASTDLQTVKGVHKRTIEKNTEVSFMIWTIHFGLDNWGTDSCERLYQLIQKTQTDVVGLLESDMARPQNGVRDIVEYVAFRLGYKYVDFGPTSADSTFGSAIISRYPIVSLKRHIMPSPVGELAPMIEAVLDVEGTPVVTFVGHFGNTDHKWDLRLQSQFLGQRAASYNLPAVFLGYLTTDVRKHNYHYMVRREPTQKHLPVTEEHIPSLMEHEKLFKDTAYEIYQHSHWIKINALQKKLIDQGKEADAFNTERVVDHWPGDVHAQIEKHHYETAFVDDAIDHHTDEWWKKMRTQTGIWREQDNVNDTFVYFPFAKRVGVAHPRWDYWDRYCQHVLYKPGFEDVNSIPNPHSGKVERMHLKDWFRWNYVNDLSDTEIQVARFVFGPDSPLKGG